MKFGGSKGLHAIRLWRSLLGVFGLTTALSAVDPAFAQQIWLGPNAPHGKAKGADDWQQLFNPAALPDILPHVSAVILSQYYFNDTSDDQIIENLRFLHSRNIKVVLPVQSIARSPSCGGVEGFENQTEAQRLLSKAKRLGLKIDMIRLDEPLWFGSYDPGGNPRQGLPACQYSPESLAKQVFADVNEYVETFPDVVIGEVEPVPVATSRPTFQKDYVTWKREFESLSGRKITFLHTEVHSFDPSWASDIQSTARFARGLGMSFGVIYNAGGDADSDQGWVKRAIDLFETVESDVGIVPDDAVIQSWESRPSHFMPPSSEDTLSHVVATYLLPRTKLIVHRSGATVTGQLVYSSLENRPVSGAKIAISIPGAGGGRPMPLRSFAGIVPPGAHSAIMGIRLNAECNCSGSNDILVGNFKYKEVEGGTIEKIARIEPSLHKTSTKSIDAVVRPETYRNESVVRLQTSAAEKYLFNSQPFSVTPNARFVFSVPIENVNGQSMTGYATIIWRDASGRGLTRAMIRGTVQYTPVSDTVTDSSGRFSVTLPAGETGKLRIHAAGTTAFRGAYAHIP